MENLPSIKVLGSGEEGESKITWKSFVSFDLQHGEL